MAGHFHGGTFCEREATLHGAEQKKIPARHRKVFLFNSQSGLKVFEIGTRFPHLNSLRIAIVREQRNKRN